MVQADPDLRDAGQRGTGGTEEKDHDTRPHPLGEKNTTEPNQILTQSNLTNQESEILNLSLKT